MPRLTGRSPVTTQEPLCPREPLLSWIIVSSGMHFIYFYLGVLHEMGADCARRRRYRRFFARVARALPYRHFTLQHQDRWDCGIVNHSPYAMLFGVPVAVIGIAGYLLLGVLAFRKAYRVMLVAALGGLGFALYLAHIESAVLGVWCIYCVISLGVISLVSLLVLGRVIVGLISRTQKTA